MVEKRSHPRVFADMPIRLGAISSATVRDISKSGVRCLTPEPLAPMTVVALRIELPTGREGSEAWLELPCEGVVVRCTVVEEEGRTRYESAILFQGLGSAEDKLLSSFVENRLSSRAD